MLGFGRDRRLVDKHASANALTSVADYPYTANLSLTPATRDVTFLPPRRNVRHAGDYAT